MVEREYHRLTYARSRSAFAVAFMSRSSLWLGKDHLLCVDSSGYSETYKRFYFRDIQTISLMKSKRWILWNWILAVPTILCLALLLTALSSRPYWEEGITIVYAIFASLFGVPLLFNNLRGPTCICQLRTAVQIEELPSLNRLRRAHRALARLRPLIVAAQGELTPEEISSRIRATDGTPHPTAPAMAPEAAPAPATTVPAPDAPPVISGMGPS